MVSWTDLRDAIIQANAKYVLHDMWRLKSGWHLKKSLNGF